MGIYFVGCSIHVDKNQKNGLETGFLVLYISFVYLSTFYLSLFIMCLFDFVLISLWIKIYNNDVIRQYTNKESPTNELRNDKYFHIRVPEPNLIFVPLQILGWSNKVIVPVLTRKLKLEFHLQ